MAYYLMVCYQKIGTPIPIEPWTVELWEEGLFGRGDRIATLARHPTKRDAVEDAKERMDRNGPRISHISIQNTNQETHRQIKNNDHQRWK